MYVITGGGSGIGKALAIALANKNLQVLICGRHEKTLKDTAANHSNIRSLVADLSTNEGIKTVADFCKSQSITGLIHNAGTIEPIIPLSSITQDSWSYTQRLNVEPALFLTQALLSKLKHKRVLNISSGVAHFAVKTWASYCCSKASLSMLTKCWQLEEPDIAFAAVNPGIIDTNMQALIREHQGMDEEKQDFFKKLHQTGGLISPDTLATFLTWLLLDCDRNFYISQEWDIYDTSHHHLWLKAPHCVPSIG